MTMKAEDVIMKNYVTKNGLSSSFSVDLRKVQSKLVLDEVTGSNVMLVSQGGRIIYEHVVNSNRKGDRDITNETLFSICSLTKPITIVAALILYEKGLLDINAPVKEYLPVFREIKVKSGGHITTAKNELLVHHLMSHRSGYSYNYSNNPDSPLPRQGRFRDLEEFVNIAANTPVEFEPGTDFVYGINQAILGRLVEVIGKEPLEAFLVNNIFRPLDMNTTSFSLSEDQRKLLQPLFINSGNLKGFSDVAGYSLDPMMSTFDPESRAHFGGEGLVSSLKDYSNFCEMLAFSGEFRGKRILMDKSIQEIIQTNTQEKNARAAFFDPKSGNDNWWAGYDVGLGVFVKNKSGNDETMTPVDTFGWSGMHNLHFWVDSKNQTFGLFMSRSLDFKWEIPTLLRHALYGQKV